MSCGGMHGLETVMCFVFVESGFICSSLLSVLMLVRYDVMYELVAMKISM